MHSVDRLCYIGQDSTTINRDSKEACVELVSLLYTWKLEDSSDTIRYELFSKKNLGTERLPPTDDTFTRVTTTRCTSGVMQLGHYYNSDLQQGTDGIRMIQDHRALII